MAPARPARAALSCGINTGTMVVGNIGSEQVFNYTALEMR